MLFVLGAANPRFSRFFKQKKQFSSFPDGGAGDWESEDLFHEGRAASATRR